MANGNDHQQLDDVLSQDLNVNIQSLAEELNFATSLEEKVKHEEEVWNEIELVGLSQEIDDIVLTKENMTSKSEEINYEENEGVLDDTTTTTTVNNDVRNDENADNCDADSGDVANTSDVEDSNGEENGYNSEDDESQYDSAAEGRLRKISTERKLANDDSDDSRGEEGDEEDEDDEEYEDESEYSGTEAPNESAVEEDRTLVNDQKIAEYKKHPSSDNVSDSDSVYESEEDGEQKAKKIQETASPNEKEEKCEEEVANPTVVPRRTGFWDHDNRFTDISIEESRQPQGNRKLWDKSEIDRWQHDCYVESEQGPKEEWEKANSAKEVEERERWQQHNGNRRGPKFGDFFPNSEMGDSNNNNSRGRNRGSYRGGKRPNYNSRQYDGTGPNNQDNYHNYDESGSQDYRMRDANNYRNPDSHQNYRNNNTNRQEHEEFPELNHAYSKSDKNSNDYPHKNSNDYPHKNSNDYSHKNSNNYSHENSNDYPHKNSNDYPGEENRNTRGNYQRLNVKYKEDRNMGKNEYNTPENNRPNNRQSNYSHEYVKNDNYRKSNAENNSPSNHENRRRNHQPSQHDNDTHVKAAHKVNDSSGLHNTENNNTQDKHYSQSNNNDSNKQDKHYSQSNNNDSQYDNPDTHVRKESGNHYRNQPHQQSQQQPQKQQHREREQQPEFHAENNQHHQQAKPQQQHKQPVLQQEQHQRQQSSVPRDEKMSIYASEETPARGVRGRGRGVVDANFKPVYRADEFIREKSSREKRIDQLAPRLREKAREKMVREEREKGKDVKESVDYDPEVYKDAEEGVISPDGAVRDKPKRYSSQRQKPGASLLNLPGEVADYIEAEYYEQPLDGMQQQQMYNPAPLPVQHIPQLQENIDINKTVKIKILEQQIMQLQAQLHQQSLGPANGIPPSYAVHSNEMMQSVGPENHQQPQGYNMESVYNVHNGMMQTPPVNDQDNNPARMSHMMATMGYPHHPAQQNMMPGGLYVPPQQQLPMNEYGYHQQPSCLRPAAIPIKPPPGLQR